MITVDKYNLFYNTEHLLSKRPETYPEIIARLEKLECRLFYNIISSPDCNYERKFSKGRIQEHYKNLSAEERFRNIFIERILYANPKSFFVNKVKGAASSCEQIKSVSFALADYSEIPRHFAARGSEFGICFFHDFLQDNGLRPVEYLHANSDEHKKQLAFNSPHLVEVSNAAYNQSWENEWRVKRDLHFTQDDIAFVIVPASRHAFYVNWFSDQDDFEDIQVISSDVYNSYVDHLIRFPQQIDNSWHQVEIYRNEYGKGFKVNPEDFNGLSPTQKKIFLDENKNELECLAKNTILTNYEHAYTSRFLRFKDQISSEETIAHLFPDYQLISENSVEPEEAQRDLVRGLIQSLYSKYPN